MKIYQLLFDFESY